VATKKPRVNVTLTQNQYNVFKSLSDSSGQAMSALIGEIVELSMPTFERMAATFQQLKKAKDADRARMAVAFEETQSFLEPLALAAVGQFDLFLGKIEDVLTPRIDASARSVSRGVSTASAPPTNRGVTPLVQETLQANNSKGLRPVLDKKVSKKVSRKKEV
jgi:hypothetical protein